MGKFQQFRKEKRDRQDLMAFDNADGNLLVLNDKKFLGRIFFVCPRDAEEGEARDFLKGDKDHNDSINSFSISYLSIYRYGFERREVLGESWI